MNTDKDTTNSNGPTIADTINAAYKQWQLMDAGICKDAAYTETAIDGAFDTAMSCHFCDFSDPWNNESCQRCPAVGMWGYMPESRWNYSECEEAENSPYMQWMDKGDAKPMLDLIKQVAEKHGVKL